VLRRLKASLGCRYRKERAVSVVRLTAVTERQAGFIEGYANACDDLLGKLTGDRFSGKSYDPATVNLDAAIIHSYAFNLKDGGRHHMLADYESVDEITALMAAETLEAIRDHFPIKAGEQS
jgi:hypothetical protein